jgi:16S rRNA (cytosine1402-N4)-methyltransferase
LQEPEHIPKTTDELKKIFFDQSICQKELRIKILAQIYQAIRIEVNHEMDVLGILRAPLEIFKPEGRLSTFSSFFEDRLVKKICKKTECLMESQNEIFFEIFRFHLKPLKINCSKC